MLDLLNFDRKELAAELASTLSFEPFRADQLTQWIFRHRLRSFEEMSDISKEARAKLQERYCISRPKIVQCQKSKDGTRKYLLEMEDGSQIESVLIAQPTRFTLCISSQVGCTIGCSFCQTGRMGLTRHLKPAEIIGQVLAVQDDIEQRRKNPIDGEPEPVDFSNLVFMGMGEPLHNLENVCRAVRILNDTLGFGFSGRKITVSTSGLVPAIKRFAEDNAQANLAVSLNATTDKVRDELIPINRRWPIKVLLDTLREYPLKSRQHITIEYVMLRGVNDTLQDLKRLPSLLHGIQAKVNLIPYNKNPGLNYDSPLRNTVASWHKSLLDAGLTVTVRWSKGIDIDAACGQLATESRRKSRL